MSPIRGLSPGLGFWTHIVPHFPTKGWGAGTPPWAQAEGDV